MYMDFLFLFFKQKTAYERRISDWSSDVCSSDLIRWLSPLPEAAIVEAVAACRNVLIVDETRRTGGVAEALMALLTERTQVPHARLTAQDSFIATGPAYGATMPSCDDIVEAARNLVKGGW